MDLTIQLLFLIPFVVTGIVFLFFRQTVTFPEALCMFAITTAVIAGIYFAGKYSQVADVKYHTGEITSKERKNDSHLESYSCRCHRVCSGSGKHRSCRQECDTCWRTRYTVDWWVNSTLGKCVISSTNSLSSSVWSTPDPQRYTIIKNGDPLQKSYNYSNYIKGVPESILHISPMISKYEKIIPEYPQIYDIYRFNHAIQIQSNMDAQKLEEINIGVQNILKKTSPQTHLNVIVVFTSITDKGIKFALENKWKTGKMNDTIIFFSLDEMNNVQWADVDSWMHNENNEESIAALKNEIVSMKMFDKDVLFSVLSQYATSYKEPNMAKFEYLKDAIQPPMWVIILCFILEAVGLLGLAIYFHRVDVFGNNSNNKRYY